jgi:hypothetical protein
MPRNEIDYSNTIIYKITCKDIAIKDVYVGHTTNFVQRKHAHKQSCINTKSLNYKCKLYEVIRKNGGWENWQMDIINFFNCADHYSARKKEQEYFISLNATLNSIEPLPKPKVITKNIIRELKSIYFCNTCNIYCYNSKTFDIHKNTKKHIKIYQKNENPDDNQAENPIEKHDYKFQCESCDFLCSKNSDYNRHLITAKHLMADSDVCISDTPSYICSKCNHIFKHASSLSRHKKNCVIIQPAELKKEITFNCNKCEIGCFKQNNYNQHLLTDKHINLKSNIYNSKNSPKQYICLMCKNIYKHASTLSVHKKKCKMIEEKKSDPDLKMLTSLMLEMIKSNNELQKQIMEISKKG